MEGRSGDGEERARRRRGELRLPMTPWICGTRGVHHRAKFSIAERESHCIECSSCASDEAVHTQGSDEFTRGRSHRSGEAQQGPQWPEGRRTDHSERDLANCWEAKGRDEVGGVDANAEGEHEGNNHGTKDVGAVLAPGELASQAVWVASLVEKGRSVRSS